jgi:putative ABC transport system ATP-binding protein
MTTRMSVSVRCVGVSQVYDVDGEQVHALSDVDAQVAAGESVALFGPSGSGKSTLLSLLAGLRRPTRGHVLLDETDLTSLSERALLRLRGEQIGVVLQNPSRSLLPYGTAEDNIRFAQRSADRSRRRDLPAPRPLLERLGLADLAGQQTARLSGGEQQRLSIAVAMAGLPQLLLADEPTSQLDGENRDRVVELMTRVGSDFGTTIVVVTHDPVVADAGHRTISLAEGRVVDDGRAAQQPYGGHATGYQQ